MIGIREQRTLLNFAVLIVVAVSTTIFLLEKAKQAVAEINSLTETMIYAQRDIHSTP